MKKVGIRRELEDLKKLASKFKQDAKADGFDIELSIKVDEENLFWGKFGVLYANEEFFKWDKFRALKKADEILIEYKKGYLDYRRERFLEAKRKLDDLEADIKAAEERVKDNYKSYKKDL